MAGFRILEQDGPAVAAEIVTPHGTISVLTNLRLEGNRLLLYDFHIDGPGPGSLGREGLLRLLDQVMAEYDVDTLEIHGFRRTTGAKPGRIPRPLVFRRR